MAEKKKLEQMVQKRTPAAPRETVNPVHLYGQEPDASEPVKKQSSKPAKKKSNPGIKFASYLKPESIEALKIIAVRTKRNDYEVLQEAVDAYLAKGERKAVSS